MTGWIGDLAPETYAAKLRQAHRSGVMRGQRRLVTILFSDVVGSTAMAEQLDPEDWADIMQGAFAHMVEPIYRYEGIVGRLMGDAIVAFFGAPIAHEDDAKRAVLAGLDIVRGIEPFARTVAEDHGLDFRLRVGINTGTVVVGDIGPDLAMEYTAMGDATNLASRMESTAEPGTVQIAHSTFRLVSDAVEVEDLGSIEVKGKAEPVAAYRVTGMRKVADHDSGHGRPLAGRGAETERLREHVARTRAGRGGIVFITGDGGVGKTRLLAEARQMWEEANTAEDVTYPWNEERALSYEADRPNSIFVRLLDRDFGIERTDDPETARRRLEAAFGEGGSSEETEAFRAAFDALLALLGVEGTELEGEGLKQQLVEAIRFWVRAMSAKGPIAIVRDDLQWLDSNSVDITRDVFSLVEERPILFLYAMRPVRDSDMWVAKDTVERDYPHRFDEVRLGTLADHDGIALLSEMVDLEAVPSDFTDSILRKASGNPLFLEEVVRGLADEGVLVRTNGRLGWGPGAEKHDLSIPDTLHALLLGRIDALDPDTREIVQAASVLGRSFDRSLLAAVCSDAVDLDDRLNTLERVDVIEETQRLPKVVYAFRQELVRDAAYQSLLRRRRRELHLQVGEAIERTSDDLAGDAPTLALHFTRAGDTERAFSYSSAAAAEAARVYATAEAATHFRRAIDLAGDRSGAVLTDLYLQLGRMLELSGRADSAAAVYRELRAEAERRDDRRMGVDAANALATILATYTSAHDPDEARRVSDGAIRDAAALDYPAGEAKALWNRMLAARFGDASPEDVAAWGERSLAIARTHGLDEQVAYTLSDLAPQFVDLGRAREAKLAFDEALGLWRDLENEPMLANLLIARSDSLQLGARFQEALDMAEEAIEIGSRIGNVWAEVVGSGTLLLSAIRLGEIDRGLAATERMDTLGDRAGFAREMLIAASLHALLFAAIGAFDRAEQAIAGAEVAGRGSPLGGGLRALICWLRGDHDGCVRAYEQVEGALDASFRPRHSLLELVPLLVRGYRGENEEALAGIDLLLERMRSTGLRAYEPDVLTGRAEVLDALGRRDEATRDLEAALDRAVASTDRYGTVLVVARMLHRAPEPGSRDSILATGRDAVDFIRDHISDVELRSNFLTQPTVAAILAG